MNLNRYYFSPAGSTFTLSNSERFNMWVLCETTSNPAKYGSTNDPLSVMSPNTSHCIPSVDLLALNVELLMESFRYTGNAAELKSFLLLIPPVVSRHCKDMPFPPAYDFPGSIQSRFD